MNEVAAAEARAALARERLSTTVAQIQAKLDPREMAQRAVRDVGDAGSAAIETAKGNPGAVAGAVAVAGLFLARHRIAALFRKTPNTPAEAGLNPVTRIP